MTCKEIRSEPFWMPFFFAKSESPFGRQPQPKSLARHMFVRVAFPVAIVFLSSFLLLDQFLQAQLRGHIQEDLKAWDSQTHRANADGAERLRRLLGPLAEATGSAKGLRFPASGELERNVSRLAALLDEDVVSIAAPDKSSLITLRRKGSEWQRAGQAAPIPEKRMLEEIDGQYYFLMAYPIVNEGKAAGWVVAGRHWLREMPLGEGWYVLSRNGKVVQASGTESATRFSPGAHLAGCVSQFCEVDMQGQRYLLMRSEAAASNSDVTIHMVKSFDLLATPLLGMTRSIMLGGALLSLFGALGLALFTGRAVSRPLRSLTEYCARAEESGQLSDVDIPPSRIEEIQRLGQTLQAAVRSVEQGQNQLTQAYFQFMGAIVAMLDARDPYTAGHSHRVSAYSEALARDAGLPPNQVDDIRIGALLHDIGKIGVPDEVLHKHERLTKAEFDLMKQHPTIGKKVLEQVIQFERYLDPVELHHENLDGTGYPRGLKGDQIPMSARIVKVADVYDALSTDRPYRKGMPPEKVHEILREGAGSHFDRLLVEIFLTRSVPSFSDQKHGLAHLQRAVGSRNGEAPAPRTERAAQA